MNALWTRAAAADGGVMRRLQAENDTLRAENAVLRGELGLTLAAGDLARIQQHFGVSPVHARILLALLRCKAGVLSPHLLEAAIAAGRPGARDPSSNIVAAHICELRRRVGKTAVRTVNRSDYALSPAMREHVDALLQGWP